MEEKESADSLQGSEDPLPEPESFKFVGESQKYVWLSFPKEKKEINYLKRFLKSFKGKINPEELGIPELSGEIIADYKNNGPTQLSDVADNIMKRLRRYGELDCLYSFARKSDPKMSENDLYDNFYDQNDPFIDDSGFDKTFEARKPLMPESKIDDFYCVEGEISELTSQGFMGDREKFLKGIRKKSRKRDTKKRKLPEHHEGEEALKKIKPEEPEIEKENVEVQIQVEGSRIEEEPITINTSQMTENIEEKITNVPQIVNKPSKEKSKRKPNKKQVEVPTEIQKETNPTEIINVLIEEN